MKLDYNFDKKTVNEISKEMADVIKILNKATEAYDRGVPIMTDKEWDDFYFWLKSSEDCFNFSLPNSPTQKIHFEVVSELKKVKHNHEMLSLAKTKDINEVKNFLNEKPYLAMAKMDGLTCSLTYEDGKLIRAETRGDGEIGEDILHNALVIDSIPKEIPYFDELIVDGEIICTEQEFDIFRNKYKNPRNFAAGSIRLLDSKECKKRHLTFIAWDVIKGLENKTTSLFCKMDFLIDFGFETVPSIKENSFKDNTHAIKSIAEYLGYPIDGVVFKFDDTEYGASLGKTAHHFNNAIAYKFYDEGYETELEEIEWTMGRTGVLTPVAIFKSIEIDGTEVSRASLHNVSVLKDTLHGTGWKGQKVTVVKMNMIIPQIESAEESTESTTDFFSLPTKCPICGEELWLKSNEGILTLHCKNIGCEGKIINKLDHFCSKKGLDIKGLSKATLEKLLSWKYIDSCKDIFTLEEHKEQWVKASGFGEKSVDKILNSINQAKQTTLDKVIAAAGIPLIGTSVAKDLAKKFNSYEEFREAINEGLDFSTFENYGFEMNKALHSFDYSELDLIVKNYLDIKVKEEKKNVSKSLEGLTFVVTGKLKKYKNRNELKEQIESFGGKVGNSITKKTNYLINNDNTSTSSKNIAAKNANIPIITEEEFIKIFDI